MLSHETFGLLDLLWSELKEAPELGFTIHERLSQVDLITQ